MGLGLAGQPADPLQPGVGRPGRQAVERAEEIRLVGRGAAPLGRRRRARLRGRPRSGQPPRPGSRRPGRPRGRRPVHHAVRRQGMAVRPERAWSTGRCPRTTSRRSHPSPTRSTRSSRVPRGSRSRGRTTCSAPSAGAPGVGRVPVRVHHLPADRAPHRRRDEPLAAVPLRAAAGDVLRGVARAGRRARPRALRLGHHHLAARGDRGAGAGHRPDDPAGHRRPHRAPDRAAVPLGRGQATPSSPATRPTTCSASRSTPTCRSRSPRPDPATSAPGRRPRGADLLRLVADYQARSGATIATDNARITDPAHEIVDPPRKRAKGES